MRFYFFADNKSLSVFNINLILRITTKLNEAMNGNFHIFIPSFHYSQPVELT